MSYVILILIGVAVLLMAYNIHLGKEVHNSQFKLDVTNESLKSAEADLETLARQRKVAYLETQHLQSTKDSLQNDVAFLNQAAARMRQENRDAETILKQQIDKDIEEYRQEVFADFQKEYDLTRKEFIDDFIKENSKKLNAAKELSNKLIELRTTVDAATKIAKAAQEQLDYKDFHRLQLSEEEIQDINKIESAVIGISMTAQSAIAKALWKVYYEKAYTDLIGRVLGNNKNICGIYKITELDSSRCYVGQAVDIADRWRQHIKRAIGADDHTNNKLYPAMNKLGVWHFIFEVIEECSREKLNEREDYWQEFYHAKDFGYSIK